MIRFTASQRKLLRRFVIYEMTQNNFANVVILRKTYLNLKNIMGTFVYTLPIGKCKTFYGRN